MEALTKTVLACDASLYVPHDFTTLIGYTRPPVNGGEPRMDDLASDNPTFREIRETRIRDLRGMEDGFTLEKNGFQYYKLPQVPGDGIVDFTNEGDPRILDLYYAGMATWFAKV